MTGAGFAAGPSEHGELRVEVRAVNGRSLVTKMRLPTVCSGYEAAIEELLRQQLQRGSVTVVVERVQQAANLPDPDVVRRVAAELRQLAAELDLQPPTLAEVLQAAASGRGGDAPTSRPLPPQLAALFATAMADLLRHRQSDGQATVAAIEAILAQFEEQLATARARAPQLADRYRERLMQRVQEFVAAQAPEAAPITELVREVAIYADRVDVAEELQRLDTHLAEVRQVLARGGDVGRKLEFLLQELLRETNTMGAKSPDTAMTHAVVAMKTCIDRLKEQAANLE
ncbi:MAG: YicC family protein [Planctomycetes bacterium]|nr:YicC family protein [Planctomycetota bacterium]